MCCCDELFATLLSLSVSTRVVTLRVVFFLVPHFPNICGACFFLSQGMRFGFLRRPHSIFMCQCFHCCSSRNELRDEKWFCSDLLALCVWQTFVLGKFARQMVVITVVTSKQSCVSSSGLRLLEYFGDSSGRLDASFRGRAHFACVLQMILDSFHSPRVCADDSRPTTTVSRAVLYFAASVWCCVCRCVLE